MNKKQQRNQQQQSNNNDEDRKLRKLFVDKLSANITDKDIREVFEKYGEIEEVAKYQDRRAPKRYFAFVVYKHAADCLKATKIAAPVIKGKKCACILAAIGKQYSGYKYFVAKGLLTEDQKNSDLSDKTQVKTSDNIKKVVRNKYNNEPNSNSRQSSGTNVIDNSPSIYDNPSWHSSRGGSYGSYVSRGSQSHHSHVSHVSSLHSSPSHPHPHPHSSNVLPSFNQSKSMNILQTKNMNYRQQVPQFRQYNSLRGPPASPLYENYPSANGLQRRRYSDAFDYQPQYQQHNQPQQHQQQQHNHPPQLYSNNPFETHQLSVNSFSRNSLSTLLTTPSNTASGNTSQSYQYTINNDNNNNNNKSYPLTPPSPPNINIPNIQPQVQSQSHPHPHSTHHHHHHMYQQYTQQQTSYNNQTLYLQSQSQRQLNHYKYNGGNSIASKSTCTIPSLPTNLQINTHSHPQTNPHSNHASLERSRSYTSHRFNKKNQHQSNTNTQPSNTIYNQNYNIDNIQIPNKIPSAKLLTSASSDRFIFTQNDNISRIVPNPPTMQKSFSEKSIKSINVAAATGPAPSTPPLLDANFSSIQLTPTPPPPIDININIPNNITNPIEIAKKMSDKDLEAGFIMIHSPTASVKTEDDYDDIDDIDNIDYVNNDIDYDDNDKTDDIK